MLLKQYHHHHHHHLTYIRPKQHTTFSHTTSKTPKSGIKTNNEVKRSFEIKPSNPTQMERGRKGKGSWNRKLGWDLLKL
jgi:hypothetical protein